MGIIAIFVMMVIFIPVLFFLTLAANNIIFVDSLIVSILGAVLFHTCLGLHPVICILGAAAIMAGMTKIYLTATGVVT